MGPSGAGKDSVMNRGRALLPATAPVFFAHRYITRPADIGGENHIALTEAEFRLRRDHGLFAFDWEAHGNRYAIGSEIQTWRTAGLTVVVSGPRRGLYGGRCAAGDDRERRLARNGGRGLRQLDRQTSVLTRRPPPSL
jgi:ribose 1,5-bisphosphokinase